MDFDFCLHTTFTDVQLKNQWFCLMGSETLAKLKVSSREMGIQ